VIKINGIDIQKFLPGMLWMMHNGRPFLIRIGLVALLGVLGPLSGVAIAIASKYLVDYAIKGDLRGIGIEAAFLAYSSLPI
jgi:hypothetical protein